MKLLVEGDGLRCEWEARKLRRETIDICHLKVVIELDPDMSGDKIT